MKGWDEELKKRVEWIDIAKFVGIFAIYLGHFGQTAGLAYSFVFSFHVPLFFFISGCMSNYDKETNIWKFIVKRFQAIMIPFYIFGFLSIFLNVIIHNMGLGWIKEQVILVLKGCIRNSFFAGGLWFLSCLFVMEVVFKLIKCVKNRVLISVIAIAFFLVAELVIQPHPIREPHWMYNIDSMMYYMVFYAIGYCIYPFVIKLFELDTKLKKSLFVVFFLLTAAYTGLLFEGISIGKRLSFNSVSSVMVTILQPIVVIMFVLCLSKLLEGIEFLSKVGRETLYLCGNEFICKSILPMVLSLFGLSINVDSPLKAWIYSLVLISVNVRWLIPAEKKLLSQFGMKTAQPAD